MKTTRKRVNLFLNWTDVCRRYDKDLLLWHEGYSALWRTLLYLLLGFLPIGSLVYEFFP
jgi:hypothetical protein